MKGKISLIKVNIEYKKLMNQLSKLHIVVIQSLSGIWFFAISLTIAHQPPLYFTISQSFLKSMSTESVTISNHLILWCPLLLLLSIFPSVRVFSSESALHIRWPNIEASASVSVFPMNIQGWFPLWMAGFIYLQSKGLSVVFCLWMFECLLWRHRSSVTCHRDRGSGFGRPYLCHLWHKSSWRGSQLTIP